MTPEQGYEYAKRHVAGVYVSMAQESARIKRIPPISHREMSKLPDFPSTWLGYRLGFEPTAWTMGYVFTAACYDHKATDDEIKWLDQKSTGKRHADEWLDGIINDQ